MHDEYRQQHRKHKAFPGLCYLPPENIILTPISAHTIQAKAMVLDKNRLIDVTVPKQSRKTAYLSVDGGKAFKLFAGDTVQVTRSRRCLCLVRLSDKSFYEKINRKLERRIHS